MSSVRAHTHTRTHTVTYKETAMRLSAGFSAENLQEETETIYSKYQKEKTYNQEHYPASLSFKIEGEIKSFSDK